MDAWVRHPDSPWRTVLWRLAMALFLVFLGVLLVRVPLKLAGLLVGALLGGIALLRWPALGFCALAFAVPFGSTGGLAALPMGLAHILVAITATVLFMRAVVRRRVDIVSPPFLLSGLLYLLILFLSLLPAAQLAPALKDLIKWGEFLLLSILVASELDVHWVRWLLISLIGAGILQGLLGIYQFLYQVGPPGFILMGRYMRAYGSFEQPNPYAGYLGLLLPLCCTIFLLQPPWRDKSRENRRGIFFSRVALWCVAALGLLVMAAALLMSWSRGGLLGLAGGGLLVLLAWGKRAWIVALLVAFLMLLLGPTLAALAPTNILSRVMEAEGLIGQDLAGLEITDENFSLIERLAHWQAAWRMFARAPWLGVGTGQYAVAYPDVALPRWQDPLGHAHNYYLNSLAEGGLIGLLAYAVLMLSIVWGVWRRATTRRGLTRAVALGTLGMLGHLMAHNLVDNLWVHEMYLVVAMALGSLYALTPAGGEANCKLGESQMAAR